MGWRWRTLAVLPVGFTSIAAGNLGDRFRLDLGESRIWPAMSTLDLLVIVVYFALTLSSVWAFIRVKKAIANHYKRLYDSHAAAEAALYRKAHRVYEHSYVSLLSPRSIPVIFLLQIFLLLPAGVFLVPVGQIADRVQPSVGSAEWRSACCN